MTKADAIQKAGSIKLLADLLGISTQAISKWDDGQIPEAREWQIRLLKPEWFYKSTKEQKK